MKSYIWVTTIIFSFMCSRHNSFFDEVIQEKIGTFDYNFKEIDDDFFEDLKKKTNKARPLTNPYFSGLDYYLLTEYIHINNPTILELQEKYTLLSSDEAKFIFIENIFFTNKDYFQKYEDFFINLINQLNLDQSNNKHTKLLLQEFLKERIYGFEGIRQILDSIGGLNRLNIPFLKKLIIREKETDFSLHLLRYLANQDEWGVNTDLFYQLYKTQNPVLNESYKSLYKESFFYAKDSKYSWQAFHELMLLWLSESEIIEICNAKKSENISHQLYFYDTIRTVSSLELYVFSASFFQAKYFPFENTISIIDKLKIVNQKLFLICLLANLEIQLTDENKAILLSRIYAIKDEHFDSDATKLLIVALRSLDKNLSFEQITKSFPNIRKKYWFPEDFLSKFFKDCYPSSGDFVAKATQYNTFDKPIYPLSTYFQYQSFVEYLQFRLYSYESILQQNDLKTNLQEEYGWYPINYADIINSTFKKVIEVNLDTKFDCFYDYRSLNKDYTEYIIFLRLGNKMHVIKFTSKNSILNIEAIYLLINKSLIDLGTDKRFYKYKENSYDMAFVSPTKFDKLLEKIKK